MFVPLVAEKIAFVIVLRGRKCYLACFAVCHGTRYQVYLLAAMIHFFVRSAVGVLSLFRCFSVFLFCCFAVLLFCCFTLPLVLFCFLTLHLALIPAKLPMCCFTLLASVFFLLLFCCVAVSLCCALLCFVSYSVAVLLFRYMLRCFADVL